MNRLTNRLKETKIYCRYELWQTRRKIKAAKQMMAEAEETLSHPPKNPSQDTKLYALALRVLPKLDLINLLFYENHLLSKLER